MLDSSPYPNFFRGAHPRRVLILHSLYRTAGGEEAAINSQVRLFGDAGVECQKFYRGPSGDALSLFEKMNLARGLFGSKTKDAELQKTLDEFDPGVVHVHNLLPHFGATTLDLLLTWALRKGRIIVSSIHNHRWYCANGLGFRAGHFCDLCVKRNNPLWGAVYRCRGSASESIAYAGAISLSFSKKHFCHPNHKIVVLNERMSRRILKVFPGASVTILPNPIAQGVVSSLSSFRERFPEVFNWSGPQVAVIGRLSAEKGVQKLLQRILTASPALPAPFGDPKTRFIFAGDGPLSAEVLLAQKNSSRILSLGRISEQDVRSLLEFTQSFFFSSIVEEQCPTVLRLACFLGVKIFDFNGPLAASEVLSTWGPLINEQDWRGEILKIYKF